VNVLVQDLIIPLVIKEEFPPLELVAYKNPYHSRSGRIYQSFQDF